MRFARAAVLAVAVAFSGCGGHTSPITAPSVVSTVTVPFVVPTLSGQVVDAVTGAPISGAVVSINGLTTTITDVSGRYSMTGVVGSSGFTYVSSPHYESDYRFGQGSQSLDIRLRPIEWVSANSSTTVTIAPDDSLCVNNMQDSPGWGPSYVCRAVRVKPSSKGILTLVAEAIDGGPSPLLEVEAIGAPVCCLERLQNPTSIEVTKDLVVVARVEMLMGSTAARRFTLTTTMNPN